MVAEILTSMWLRTEFKSSNSLQRLYFSVMLIIFSLSFPLYMAMKKWGKGRNIRAISFKKLNIFIHFSLKCSDALVTTYKVATMMSASKMECQSICLMIGSNHLYKGKPEMSILRS